MKTETQNNIYTAWTIASAASEFHPCGITLPSLVAWLEWNDPNGCYDGSEGWKPTRGEALMLIAGQLDLQGTANVSGAIHQIGNPYWAILS